MAFGAGLAGEQMETYHQGRACRCGFSQFLCTWLIPPASEQELGGVTGRAISWSRFPPQYPSASQPSPAGPHSPSLGSALCHRSQRSPARPSPGKHGLLPLRLLSKVLISVANPRKRETPLLPHGSRRCHALLLPPTSPDWGILLGQKLFGDRQG